MLSEYFILSSKLRAVVAIYDLTNNVLHVSNARGEGEGGNAYAFERAYTRIDMSKLFAVNAPTI
jgi:hypothetical protein